MKTREDPIGVRHARRGELKKGQDGPGGGGGHCGLGRGKKKGAKRVVGKQQPLGGPGGLFEGTRNYYKSEGKRGGVEWKKKKS